MNDTRDINGTPTDSEKMDISEVSDIVSPTSDQSLCEMVDNAGTTSGFTSCESHPLDNAPESATTSRMTTTSLETSTSQVSNSMEQIPLDADSSLRSFNGSSPAESEDDPSSVYAARVADDYQDVRLRKGSDVADDPPGLVLLRRNSRRGRPVTAEFVESLSRRDDSLRVIAAPKEVDDQGNVSVESADQLGLSYEIANESNDFKSTDQSNDSIESIENAGQSNASHENADQSNAGAEKVSALNESDQKHSHAEDGCVNGSGQTDAARRGSQDNISTNGDRVEVEPTGGIDQSEGDVLRHLEVDVRVNDRAGSQTANQSGGRRRIRLSPSLLRDDAESSDDSVGADLDTLADSADELEDSILERLGGAAPEPIPELSAAEELADERAWRTCRLAGTDRAIDMKVIEPYKRVLSHGGYLAAGARNAIVVFSACFLPDRSRTDYDYVMDNLFFYVVHTLQRLVTQDYVLVYLHGGAQRSCMPTFSWLKRCYHMLDRRLRKDLKALYLVHPTFWLKTLVLMTRPFVSSKFSRKLSFVGSLEELRCILPLEQASIPDRVKQYEQIRASLTGN